jgi:hypothetical protein
VLLQATSFNRHLVSHQTEPTNTSPFFNEMTKTSWKTREANPAPARSTLATLPSALVYEHYLNYYSKS